MKITEYPITTEIAAADVTLIDGTSGATSTGSADDFGIRPIFAIG